MIDNLKVSAFIILLGCHVATWHSFAGQVISVSDGDTLTVLQDKKSLKVRLSNIDAPEKSQPFGQQSKQSLSDLCFNKDATIQPQTIDRYGRTVAIVVCDGVEANRTQVERGMAWVYTKYNKDKYLPALQDQAKDAKHGLWADPEPTPPWDWRHR